MEQRHRAMNQALELWYRDRNQELDFQDEVQAEYWRLRGKIASQRVAEERRRRAFDPFALTCGGEAVEVQVDRVRDDEVVTKLECAVAATESFAQGIEALREPPPAEPEQPQLSPEPPCAIMRHASTRAPLFRLFVHAGRLVTWAKRLVVR